MSARGRLRNAVLRWAVPQGVRETLVRWRTQRPLAQLADNRALYGRHADQQRCFVIGNGPSLGGMDLRPLASEITLGANSFYKHAHAQDVSLHYLCVMDGHFFREESGCLEWHKTLSVTSPRATIFLPLDQQAYVTAHALYAHHKVHYLVTGPPPTANLRDVHAQLDRPLRTGTTTGTLAMLPLALSLGFRTIYLLGFDANWMADTGKTYHFYKAHELFPEFDSVDADNRGFTYEDNLAGAAAEFRAHRLWRDYARAHGARIINVGVGGLLDMYPRAQYSDVVKRTG